MFTNSKHALGAFAFLALAAGPALACEDHAAMEMPTTQTAAAIVTTMSDAQSAPKAELPARAVQSAKTTAGNGPALMFEKPFRKWWTED